MAFDNMYLQGMNLNLGTDWITIGVYLRFGTIVPGWDMDFLRISKDAVGTYDLALGFNGGGAGEVYVRDATKSGIAALDLSLSADTWYLFEIKYKRDSSSPLRIWLDGNLILSNPSENLDSGGSLIRVEVRTQVGDITPEPAYPKCLVRCAGWYVITDDESTSTTVEFVGFETGGPEEVGRHGASTFETSPAPPSAKEKYHCRVIAGVGADPDD